MERVGVYATLFHMTIWSHKSRHKDWGGWTEGAGFLFYARGYIRIPIPYFLFMNNR